MEQAFRPEQLDLINQAFDQAWTELTTSPNHLYLDQEVMKTLLRDKLVALVAAGMRDPELIKKAAVHSILNDKPSNKDGRAWPNAVKA
jgi:hypothetical protein